jgi:hypothetical protein
MNTSVLLQEDKYKEKSTMMMTIMKELSHSFTYREVMKANNTKVGLKPYNQPTTNK